MPAGFFDLFRRRSSPAVVPPTPTPAPTPAGDPLFIAGGPGIPTSFAAAGLTILVSKPMIVAGVSYDPNGRLLGRLTEEVNGWTHDIQANGGYWSAEFTLDGDAVDTEDWLMDGLGRHIVCYDEDQQVVWEGFVNKVTGSFGGLAVERGPLMDIANQVELYYTPIIDPTSDPPLTGDEQPTTIATHAASQARWGVIEKILSSGQLLDAEAEQIRDLYLAENHDPKISKDFSLGGGGETVTLTVSCLGYVHWLEAYVYNNTTTPTTDVASDKIEDVLAADANGLFSTNYDEIDFNGTLVPSYENDSRTVWTIIKEIVVLGGGSDDRWVFGVWKDRVAKYEAIPTVLKYTQALSDPMQRLVDDASHAYVPPWKVKPGQWLTYTDFLIGRVTDTTLGVDPRTQFIESVVFTAPMDLKLTGSQVSTLAQKLARMGLGGL